MTYLTIRYELPFKHTKFVKALRGHGFSMQRPSDEVQTLIDEFNEHETQITVNPTSAILYFNTEDAKALFILKLP